MSNKSWISWNIVLKSLFKHYFNRDFRRGDIVTLNKALITQAHDRHIELSNDAIY